MTEIERTLLTVLAEWIARSEERTGRDNGEASQTADIIRRLMTEISKQRAAITS